MVTHDLRAVFERHRTLFNARRRAQWLELFVEQPYIEEPVGTPLRRGREHFASTMDTLVERNIKATINEPLLLITNAAEFAVHFTVHVEMPDRTIEEHIIEIFEVAPDGRIAGVRAFVTPTAMSPIS